jgi:hypothetical protein
MWQEGAEIKRGQYQLIKHSEGGGWGLERKRREGKGEVW